MDPEIRKKKEVSRCPDALIVFMARLLGATLVSRDKAFERMGVRIEW